MAVKIYNKLVRDKIPEIIEADGKTCKTEILSDEEYLKMLDAKLDEELAEYHKDQNIEELADLMEVIYAAAKARGYSVDELEKVRVKKAEERGGFGEKVFLREVESEDNVVISWRSLKELIKTKIKELIIQYKDKIYKIFYCANSAMLIMGILITFIGMYSPICGDKPNEVRTTIGAICITIWFLMFPTISMQEKDKIMQKLGIHVILSLITVLLSSMGILYFLKNMTKGHDCFQQDDMRTVYDKLKCADVIVVASPVYFYGVSAQLKAIIDRLHTPMRNDFKVKKLALILVGAAVMPELFDSIKIQYQLVLNFFKLEDAGMVLVRGAKDKGDVRNTDGLDEAYRLGLAME